MQTATVLAALAVGAAGSAASAVTAVLQAADGASNGLAPYVTGGGSAVAVSAVVWIVKKIIAGDMVAKPVAEYQRELSVMMAAMGEREDRLIRECVAGEKREERLVKALQDADRALWRVDEYLGGDEPRQHPRRRQT